MVKKIFFLILFFSSVQVFSAEFENLSVNLGYPRQIRSNESGTVEITFNNRGSIAFHNLQLSVFFDDDLDIKLNESWISVLEGGEIQRINLEITSKNRHIFNNEAQFSLRVQNDEYESNFRYRLVLLPMENFWTITVIFFALFIIFIFVIIYIKVNKGELNAG